jgi:hypothetical protein
VVFRAVKRSSHPGIVSDLTEVLKMGASNTSCGWGRESVLTSGQPLSEQFFIADSPTEGEGFEPSVPGQEDNVF